MKSLLECRKIEVKKKMPNHEANFHEILQRELPLSCHENEWGRIWSHLVYYRGIFLNTKPNRTKQFSSILPILNCFRHAGILFLQLSWTVHEQNKMYNKHKFMCHRQKIYVPEMKIYVLQREETVHTKVSDDMMWGGQLKCPNQEEEV